MNGPDLEDAPVAPYASSLEHLLAELARVDLLIRAQVARARRIHAADPEFQGLYVSEQEVEELLARPAGMPSWAAEAPRMEVEAALAELARGIAARKAESARQGVELRLERLAQIFGLSPFELDVLLVALSPELDLRYERLFSYLQDDVTKRRPSVDLVLSLLARGFAEKLAARARFAGGAPLVRHRLVELFDDAARPQPPLLARYLRADPRVVAYLLGEDDLDPRLSPFARAVDPAPRPGEAPPGGIAERLLAAVRAAEAAGNPAVLLYLQGPYGVGKETTARALCRALGCGLLAADLAPLLAADEATCETVLDLAHREAALAGAALYWERFDLLLAEERAGRRSAFLDRLAERRGLTFLAGEADWEPADRLRDRVFVRTLFPLPAEPERAALWAAALGETAAAGLDLASFSAKFRLSGGQIHDAAATAKNLARARGDLHPTLADLHAACRLQSNRKLASLAQKITPRYRLGDIVLPPDRLEQLQEICNAVRYRARVYEEWGFGRRMSLGKGVAALFAGPSGTGKTMGAEIVAAELGLDLYKIDLSTVVSKYIGETEKNLSRIFAEAEASNAVLFFDEADALFGKRSEVRDAHDRYANIETGYLLQRMEEYQGVVILATNLRKNMDEAFVRRLQFMVDFPFPGEDDRRRIWERLWPAETPRAPEVDFDLLARRFELPGGNIRNIAVAAAFLAAADGGTVTPRHLLRATQREYQKIGKVLAAGELAALAGPAPNRT